MVRHGLVALALALAAQPVSAQAVPVARTVEPMDQLPADAKPLRELYLAQCVGAGPEVQVPPEWVYGTPDMRLHARYHADGTTFGAMVFCEDATQLALTRGIVSKDEALQLLAAKRFAPLWPVFEAQWGEGLSKLRADMLAQIDRKEDDYKSMLQSETASSVGRIRVLSATGDDARAQAEAEKLFADLTGGKKAKRGRYDFDRAYVASIVAGIDYTLHGPAAAAARLRPFLEALPADNPYRLNTTVNLAAYLAEAGEYAEAFALIDPEYRAFRAEQPKGQAYSISGSDREFSWILACSLTGLGRDGEAAPYIDIVTGAAEQPGDRWLANVKPTSAIAARMYRCMDASDAWYGLFTAEELTPMHGQWIALQPAYRGYGAPPSDWTMPEAVRNRFEAENRVLPAAYDAALNGWREGDAPQ